MQVELRLATLYALWHTSDLPSFSNRLLENLLFNARNYIQHPRDFTKKRQAVTYEKVTTIFLFQKVYLKYMNVPIINSLAKE